MKQIFISIFLVFLFMTNVFGSEPRTVLLESYLSLPSIEDSILKKLVQDTLLAKFEYLNHNQFELRSAEMPDFFVRIRRDIKGNGNKVNIMFESLKSDRKAISSVNIENIAEEELVSLLAEKILDGSAYLDELSKVGAEKVVDLNQNVVQYAISSLSGEDVLLTVDYDNRSKKVQNVAFNIDGNKEDGEYSYEILTEEGIKVLISFSFLNNSVKKNRITIDYQPDLPKSTLKVFTVSSKENYEIIFEFDWNKAGEIRNVRVFPKENPFSVIHF